MQAVHEPELIARSLDGDTVAYAQLIDRYKNAVYHHCFAMVRNETAAEDMAQEAFIAAFYGLRKYDARYRFSTWLFKISTNKCLNYLRSKAKEAAADDKLIASLVSHHATPHQAAEDQELHSAVNKLEPRYRAVVSLYYWQGLSYQEIATVLAAPQGSVKGWMSRAKSQLRKELS